MVILTGNKKIKTAVFISGKGSNLKNLIKFSKNVKFPISVDLIISNNPKSKGLRYAKIFKIKKKIFNFKKKILAEKKIIKILKKYKINFIFLAGFMKILSKNFIKIFKGKIINIHPSLLPKYKGLDVHERVKKIKKIYWLYSPLCNIQIRLWYDNFTKKSKSVKRVLEDDCEKSFNPRTQALS